MPEQHHVPSDPRLFAASGLDRLGAVPLRGTDPRQVGPFQLVAVLGGGGMGRIYLGRDAGGRPGLAAVKVIRPEYAEDPQFRRRFEREATSLARVQGEYTAVLLGTGHDERLWMATEYIPGLSLSDAVGRQGPLDAAAAWRVAADLAQAVAAMSRVGVVHRDLKPSNVVIGPEGCRVIDFGIAQAAETSAITTTGQRVGTPAYMSPEQVRGSGVTTASDVFSLGSVLSYAVTGNAPFGDGTSVDVLHRVAFEEPRPDVLDRVAAVDPGLAELVAACLGKDAERRPTPEQVLESAAPRQVPAPWPAQLGAAVLTCVQAADAVRQLPLDVPPPDETVLLGGRGAAAPGGHHAVPPTPGTPAHPAPAGPYGVPGTPGTPLGATPGTPGAGLPGTPVAGPWPTPPTAPGGSYGAPYGAPSGIPYAAVPPAVPAGPPAVALAPAGAGSGRPGPGRRRGALLVGGAVLAVAAIASTAVAFAGSSGRGGTAAAGPSTATVADPASSAAASAASTAAAATASASPSASPSPSPARSTAATTAAAPSARPSRTATRTAAPGTAPATTAPAQPSWITDCTYYSGTEQTQYGDTGARVTQVQCMLVHRGYGVGPSGVDGQFGQDTEAAVKAFQTDKHIQVDGQVGPQTWAALRSTT